MYLLLLNRSLLIRLTKHLLLNRRTGGLLLLNRWTSRLLLLNRRLPKLLLRESWLPKWLLGYWLRCPAKHPKQNKKIRNLNSYLNAVICHSVSRHTIDPVLLFHVFLFGFPIKHWRTVCILFCSPSFSSINDYERNESREKLPPEQVA